MKNLETPAVKLAVYGAQSSIGHALMVEALARQFETTLVLDDLNAVDARPGLSTIQGDLYDPISVSQSIAGKDAVVCVLTTTGGADALQHTAKAVTALLDGLPVAGVKRLLLIGDFTWLDNTDASASQLQERLTNSPVVWTLFDAPEVTDQPPLLSSFASQVVDEVCHADNMHQRIRIHGQTNQPVQPEVDVMPQP
jgi:hypothetical protein